MPSAITYCGCGAGLRVIGNDFTLSLELRRFHETHASCRDASGAAPLASTGLGGAGTPSAGPVLSRPADETPATAAPSQTHHDSPLELLQRGGRIARARA